MRFIAMSVLTTLCAFGAYAQEQAGDQGNNEVEVVQSESVESNKAE